MNDSNAKSHSIAYIVLILSSAMFASGYILARAISPDVAMGMFVTLSMFFSAVTLSIFKGKRKRANISQGDIAAMVANGVGSPLIVFMGMEGAKTVTPALASVLVTSNVLMIALAAWALGRKLFRAKHVAALVCGFLGIVWISLERGVMGGEQRGIALLLGAAILIAFVTIIIEKPVFEIGWAPVTRWTFWMGSIFSAIYTLVIGQFGWLSVEQTLLCVVVGAISIAGPVVTFNLGMSKIGSADAAAIKLLIPFFALVYGILILDEYPAFKSFLAAIVVVVSVAMYQLSNENVKKRS